MLAKTTTGLERRGAALGLLALGAALAALAAGAPMSGEDSDLRFRRQAKAPVESLGEAARRLSRALVLGSPTFRCPAYAYLLRVMVAYKPLLEARQVSAPINQDFIDALAVVSTAERADFVEMFRSDLVNTAGGDLMGAVAELEGAAPAPEAEVEAAKAALPEGAAQARLDLLECLDRYFAAREPQVEQFLAEAGRAEELRSARPAGAKPEEAPIGDERPASGVVSGLKARFEKSAAGSHPIISAEDYRKASELINRISDLILVAEPGPAEVAAAPASSGGPEPAEPVVEPTGAAKPAPPPPPPAVERVPAPSEPASEPEAAAQPPSEPVSARQAEPAQPEVGAEAEAAPPAPARRRAGAQAAQLAILYFIRMRFESKPVNRYESVPEVGMDLVQNFVNNWEALEEYRASECAAAGSAEAALCLKLAAFFEADRNRKLYESNQKALLDYEQMVELCGQLELANQLKVQSLEELREPYRRLTDLVRQFEGTRYDIRSVREQQAQWAKKLAMYSVIDDFVRM